MKAAAIDAILKSEDSWFEWCIIAVEADNAATTVLCQFIDLYITIRGFAFAKICLEMYKEALENITVKEHYAVNSVLNSRNLLQLQVVLY